MAEDCGGKWRMFYEIDEETLESFKREVSAPITRAHSMENPLNSKLLYFLSVHGAMLKGYLSDIIISSFAVAEGKNPSLVTSLAYVIPRSRFTVTVFRNYL